MATLLTADLHLMGDTEIWTGNLISVSLAAKIPITMDADGCLDMDRPFPQPKKIMQRLVLIWAHLIQDWAQILGRGPNGCPYFLDER